MTAEELHHFIWSERKIEIDRTPLGSNMRSVRAQPLLGNLLIAPQYRRGNSLWRRNKAIGQRELLCHRAVRSPIGHGDDSSRTADARQLGCNQLGAGSEHRSE